LRDIRKVSEDTKWVYSIPNDGTVTTKRQEVIQMALTNIAGWNEDKQAGTGMWSIRKASSMWNSMWSF